MAEPVDQFIGTLFCMVLGLTWFLLWKYRVKVYSAIIAPWMQTEFLERQGADQQLSLELDNQRIAQVRSLFCVSIVAMLPLYCATILGNATGKFDVLGKWDLVLDLFFFLLRMCIGLLLLTCVDRVKPLHVLALYRVFMATLIVRLISFNDIPFYEMRHTLLLALRLLTGLAVINFRETLQWNILQSIIICMKFPFIGQTRLLPGSVFAFCLCELTCLISLTLATYMYELWMRNYIRIVLDLRASKSGELAVRKLLSVLCDAEVHLDAERFIVEPSPKLAHLLVGSEAANDFECFGTRTFDEFVATATDLARFEGFVAESVDSLGENIRPASSLLLQLRNLGGTCFPAELFHVHLPEPDSQRLGHFIGIRELPTHYEQANCETRPSQHMVPKVSRRRHRAKMECRSPEQEHSDSGSTSSSSSSLSHSDSWRGTEIVELEELTLEFDALDARLPIFGMFLSFTDSDSENRTQLPGFCDCLPQMIAHQFLLWMQDTVNGYLSGQTEHVHHIGPLVFNLPSGLFQDQLPFRAEETTLEFPKIPDAAPWEFETMPVQLKLGHITRKIQKDHQPHRMRQKLDTVEERADKENVAMCSSASV